MEKSVIDSIKKSTFKVFQKDISIKIGEHSKELDALLATYSETVWAYMTPWNPYCETKSEDENMQRLSQLKKKINRFKVLEGEAMAEQNSWKPERSYLILGISVKDACLLGKEFGQYAIVTGEKGKPATLQVLK
jgi:hypothetical protein